MDDKTESDLGSNQGVHEPATRVRAVTTFESHGLGNRGSTERRQQTEQKRCAGTQHGQEGEDAPIGWQAQTSWIAGWVDPPHYERSRPPGKQGASAGCQTREQCAFHKQKLD